ncbi:MAG: M48 family metallopeptidase [Candidatus Hydrogenedentota bacterium]|nr:MAG: M48 family metallopeptidase [Candidatus Hydrogenedentota bacterium]
MKYTPREVKGNVNISRTSPIKEFFLLLGGTLAVVLVIYAGLGLAVDLIVPKVPVEIEQHLGRFYSEAYENANQTTEAARLQRLLEELVRELPEDERRYRVYVVPNSKENALALPGGNILVFSDLIEEAESENELAFVLAHELGHFANRDHLRGFGRRLVLVTISAALLGQDSSITEFLMNSLLTVEMKFSQHQEKAADLWALDLLNKKYGEVAGATDFLERIVQEEKRGRFSYYFATHPHPQGRVKALEEHIKREGYLTKKSL